MKKDNQTIEISLEDLTELLNIRKQYFIICDIFKIPLIMRGQDWVGKGIVERIHQYLTGYIIRRSVAEKETGAAFTDIMSQDISDPEYEKE